MLAPKKGLLCNLNHIHLQHISLGLHLSRHPELQETSASMGGGDQTGCSNCPENCEQVDANSNNPSLKCRCCESHTQQLVTFGLQNQATQEDFPCLHAGEVASPCDPPCELVSSSSSSSSSVSSCSDFSLDDSPVSVYCKGFSREESQSPENQPNVIPIEDAQDGQSLAEQSQMCEGRDANLNPPVLRRSNVAGESPDSLCSSTSLDSQCNGTSPSVAVQETTTICANLDRNCNSLPNSDAAPLALPAPGRWDSGLSSVPEPRPRAGSIPPPVPPRPRRRLQVLNAQRAEQLLLPVRPAEPEPSSGDLCRDVGKKTITSFHELAQKRKRNATGPALAQARADRSDWLIVFSPDTELPAPSELLSSAAGQEPARPLLQHDWPVKPPSSRQREVTTFKELRFRNKPKGQPAGERAEPVTSQHPSAPLETAMGSDGSGCKPPMPLGGHLLAPMESHLPKRRRSRPGLQPIAEGQLGDAEEGGLPLRSCLPGEKGLGSGCDKDTLVRRLEGAAGDAWVPGTVERGDETCKEARPSPSAAGAAPGADRPGGGSAEGARRARGEQKKALLIAVSTAVDKIIAHFSTARNLVQKAQLGDSRLSPDVGYLLLHTLCPALYALVEDGLKPFQKDVITGQRKNSPWSVVEASVKTGSNTRSLHSLCWHVAGLAPLNSARQKFHAFILGLLNIKQLELWISHLQKSPGVISMLYSPMAFFALSQGPLPHLADELLLLIQPLSVLTFHLDLLFEHHHLSVDVRPLSRRLESPLSPAHHAAQARGAVPPSLEGRSSAAGAGLEDEIPPDALGRAAGAEGSTRSQSPAAARGLVSGPQVGAALQQTFQHVLRWGDQLSRTLLGADSSRETHKPETGPQDAEAGWWGQLSQASRIYAAPSKEKFPFVWWTKLRTATGDSSPGQAVRPQISVDEPKGTELQLLQTKAIPELSGPKPSSSADTSGTSSPEDLILPAGAGAPTKPGDPAAGEKLLPASPELRVNRNQAAPSNPEPSSPGPDKGSWLGWLFGATSPSARSFPPSPDAISARSRRPSSWLSPSARVLAVMVKGLASEKTRDQEQPERNVSDPPQTPRAVRALCDHTGAADGHLSFQKGDILQLLSTVDEDWIHCCHGNSTGLVPVGYTSLIL
ncbi:AP-4 complex accessory subunit RUSC1 isoform X1 [Grus americana]|uniref:AP-4 complex accessory subunit RUSC1 isoform X1 n=1 Tax=Grus americana TaxID=9117 RepID=UPI002407BC7E|nr:AP-4 complex accessory subunit RUSC1 isoform X1 [Grus americana]XP_054662517.1 AP-4 complex accessory subunit RUSC1 isoform X1 [Grus americana]XP_054662518.1 AP-4 complex accessory subunit RUSC1 isoform X1 [Grus americana]